MKHMQIRYIPIMAILHPFFQGEDPMSSRGTTWLLGTEQRRFKEEHGSSLRSSTR